MGAERRGKNFMFKEIKKLHKQGYKIIAGLDEAGRGPLAGPVAAAAVVVSDKRLEVRENDFRGIRDSKKLSAKQRDNWYKILTSHQNIQWGAGIVSEKIIDKINILEATKLAMVKAVLDLEKRLGKSVDFLIIDGNFSIQIAQNAEDRPRQNLPRSVLGQLSIIKADDTIFNCIAAGIIAKVTRDKMIMKLHKKYPAYGFDKHKGYGTKEHLLALRKHGPCEIHRRSFAPVKSLINNN
jgi:ribonuclease HII